MMKNYIKVEAGVLQLVKNCLERDAEEGKQSRKEILDELNKNSCVLENTAVIELDQKYKCKIASTEFISGVLHYQTNYSQQVVVYKNPITNKINYYTGYKFYNQEEFDKSADDVFLLRF